MVPPPTVLIASLVVLGSCVKPTPVDVPAPTLVSAPTPTPSGPPEIVDICVHESHDPVCVLRDDGRVSCAHIDDDHFAPPLAGITEAVELSCGEHSICVREADGAITCLDRTGTLVELDSLPHARSLAPDCAISQQGELHCWDSNHELSLQTFPKLSATLGHDDAHSLDLQRMAPGTDRSHGCVLRRDGDLWCWGWTKGSDSMPRSITNLGRAEDIRELDASGFRACWRGDGAWSCTEGVSSPSFDCDHHLCTCTFVSDSCRSLAEFPDLEAKDFQTVTDVVLDDGKCVVDLLGRIWCQSWRDGPVHELVLPQTSETTAQFESVERTPPPTALPDPDQSDCPETTRVSNRVCEHLTEPGGVLACQAGVDDCPRWCRVSHTSDDGAGCGPDGFAIVDVRGRDSHEYLLYVDGPQVWLGPRIRRMDVEGLRGGVPAMIEQHRVDADGGGYWIVDNEVRAVTVCGLVDDRPRCSSPIVQDWSFEETITDDYNEATYGEVISHEKIDYEAELTASGTDVKIEVRAGKRHANTKHQYVEGMRVLASGSYTLEALLDQPFVQLPD